MAESRTERLSPFPGLVLGALLLLLGRARMPYGYSIFLRWIVCAGCAYGAWAAYQDGRHMWTWLLGAVAILVNPIMPFRTQRADWGPFDLAGAGVLLLAASWLRKYPESQSSSSKRGASR